MNEKTRKQARLKNVQHLIDDSIQNVKLIKQRREQGFKITANERQVIVCQIVQWLGEGISERNIRQLLKSEYSLTRSQSINQMLKYAVSMIHTAYVPEKAATVFIARCERIFDAAMQKNDLKSAIAVLALQAKICGVQIDTPVAQQTNNIIQITY